MKKARENTREFNNIRMLQDDITMLTNVRDKIYNKAIVGSVLQYLETYDQIHRCMVHLHGVMDDHARAFFALNPDIRKRESHLASYKDLDWEKSKIDEALIIEEKRFWLDMNSIRNLVFEAGFKVCQEQPVNPGCWESTHMTHFWIEK